MADVSPNADLPDSLDDAAERRIARAVLAPSFTIVGDMESGPKLRVSLVNGKFLFALTKDSLECLCETLVTAFPDVYGAAWETIMDAADAEAEAEAAHV